MPQMPPQRSPAIRRPLGERISAFPVPEWRASVLGLDEGHHPRVQKLATWAEGFTKRACANRRDLPTWLVIAGPPGTAKSHVAKRVARYFGDNAVDLYIAGLWADIPTAFRRDWSSVVSLEDEDGFNAALVDMAAASLVVMDDIGAEVDRFRNGLPTERLRRVLGAIERKFVLITTNIPREKWDEVFDDRVSSRLRAASYFQTTGIPDYRPMKAKGNV